MRILYPDLVYGAIASSGVTFATINDWQYFDIIRQFGPKDCIQQIETTVNEVDALLAKKGRARQVIKATFGLGNVTHDEDFASVLAVSSILSYSHDDIDRLLAGSRVLGHGRTRIGILLWAAPASMTSAPS